MPTEAENDGFEKRFRRAIAANQKIVDELVATRRAERIAAGDPEPETDGSSHYGTLTRTEIERRERVIREMRAAGATYRSIGARLGITPQGVHAFRKRYMNEAPDG